jgi:hypothetical protein
MPERCEPTVKEFAKSFLHARPFSGLNPVLETRVPQGLVFAIGLFFTKAQHLRRESSWSIPNPLISE